MDNQIYETTYQIDGELYQAVQQIRNTWLNQKRENAAWTLEKIKQEETAIERNIFEQAAAFYYFFAEGFEWKTQNTFSNIAINACRDEYKPWNIESMQFWLNKQSRENQKEFFQILFFGLIQWLHFDYSLSIHSSNELSGYDVDAYLDILLRLRPESQYNFSMPRKKVLVSYEETSPLRLPEKTRAINSKQLNYGLAVFLLLLDFVLGNDIKSNKLIDNVKNPNSQFDFFQEMWEFITNKYANLMIEALLFADITDEPMTF